MNALIARRRYEFYKSHPDVAPVEANDALIADWATENCLSLELLGNWSVAANALEGHLALNTARKEAQPAVPEEQPAETPEPVDLRQLPVSELREIVKSQRVDFSLKLPVVYTAERIRKMLAAELRQLQTKYSSAVLNARLRGEQ